MIKRIIEEQDISYYDLEGKVEDVLSNLKNAIGKFKAKYPTCVDLKFSIDSKICYEESTEIEFIIYGFRDKAERDFEQEREAEEHEKVKRKRKYLKLKKEFGEVNGWELNE